MQENVNNADSTLTEEQRIKFYIDMWSKTVDVQMHFNMIEWKIRALALTSLTFTLGLSGLSIKNDPNAIEGHRSLLLFLALFIWLTFYLVDRFWYHPFLKAAVDNGGATEREIKRMLGISGLSADISKASHNSAPGGLVAKVILLAHKVPHKWNVMRSIFPNGSKITWNSNTKLDLFYWLIALIIFLTWLTSLIGG